MAGGAIIGFVMLELAGALHLVLKAYLFSLLSLCPLSWDMLCIYFNYILGTLQFLCFYLDPVVLQ